MLEPQWFSALAPRESPWSFKNRQHRGQVQGVGFDWSRVCLGTCIFHSSGHIFPAFLTSLHQSPWGAYLNAHCWAPRLESVFLKAPPPPALSQVIFGLGCEQRAFLFCFVLLFFHPSVGAHTQIHTQALCLQLINRNP